MIHTIEFKPPEVSGYALSARYRIPVRHVALIGLLTAPLWVLFFLGASRVLGGSPHLTLHVTLLGVVIALLDLTLFMPAMHEAVHGLVARLCGARPIFGVGSGFAYTTFREPVRPMPYLAIGLAPLVVLSAAGLAALAWWPVVTGQIMIFLVGNACGAFGDLWVALNVWRLPRQSLVCDLADGFAHYLPVPASPIAANDESE